MVHIIVEKPRGQETLIDFRKRVVKEFEQEAQLEKIIMDYGDELYLPAYRYSTEGSLQLQYERLFVASFEARQINFEENLRLSLRHEEK